MNKLRKVIVKYRVPILVLAVLLLIPSALGYLKTRVNYDILYYLPDEIETMVGQDILKDEFGKGVFAMEIVENMPFLRGYDFGGWHDGGHRCDPLYHK